MGRDYNNWFNDDDHPHHRSVFNWDDDDDSRQIIAFDNGYNDNPMVRAFCIAGGIATLLVLCCVMLCLCRKRRNRGRILAPPPAPPGPGHNPVSAVIITQSGARPTAAYPQQQYVTTAVPLPTSPYQPLGAPQYTIPMPQPVNNAGVPGYNEAFYPTSEPTAPALHAMPPSYQEATAHDYNKNT